MSSSSTGTGATSTPGGSSPSSSGRQLLRKRLTVLGYWLAFSVFLAVCPMLVRYVRLLLSQQPPYPSLWSYLSPKGELIILATAIAGESMSEVIKTQKLNDLFKVSLIIVSFVIFVFTLLLYSELANMLDSHQTLNQQFLINLSNQLFGWTILVGIVCKIAGVEPE